MRLDKKVLLSYVVRHEDEHIDHSAGPRLGQATDQGGEAVGQDPQRDRPGGAAPPTPGASVRSAAEEDHALRGGPGLFDGRGCVPRGFMRALLNTNVIVSAATTRGLCADVFRSVLAGHELVTCARVLEEVQRTH
jgi:hypothetical protein